jgi:hypothetical protein
MNPRLEEHVWPPRPTNHQPNQQYAIEPYPKPGDEKSQEDELQRILFNGKGREIIGNRLLSTVIVWKEI